MLGYVTGIDRLLFFRFYRSVYGAAATKIESERRNARFFPPAGIQRQVFIQLFTKIVCFRRSRVAIPARQVVSLARRLPVRNFSSGRHMHTARPSPVIIKVVGNNVIRSVSRLAASDEGNRTKKHYKTQRKRRDVFFPFSHEASP